MQESLSPLVEPRFTYAERRPVSWFIARDLILPSGSYLQYKKTFGAATLRNWFVRSDEKGVHDNLIDALARCRQSPWKIVWHQSHGETPFSSVKYGSARMRALGIMWWNDIFGCPEMVVFDWDKTNLDDRRKIISAMSSGSVVGYRMDRLYPWLINEVGSIPWTGIDLYNQLKISRQENWSNWSPMMARNFFEARSRSEPMPNPSIVDIFSKNRSIPVLEGEWLALAGIETPPFIQPKDFWSGDIEGTQFNYMGRMGGALLALTHIAFSEKWNDLSLIDAMGRGIDALNSSKIPEDNHVHLHNSVAALFAQTSARGLPVNKTKLIDMKMSCIRELFARVEDFYQEYPDTLVGHHATLSNLSESISKNLQEAIVSDIRALFPDVVFMKTPSGLNSTSAEGLRIAGVHASPAKHIYNLIVQVTSLKGRIRSITKIIENINRSKDDRLHAFLGFGPETDRLLSSEPNIQNFEESVRRLVEGDDNTRILSVDYSQIELRIAAALALRSQRQIHEQLIGNYDRDRPAIHQKALRLLRSINDMSESARVLLMSKVMTAEHECRHKLQNILDSIENEETGIAGDYRDIFDQWWEMRLQRAWLRVLARRGESTEYSMLAEVFRRDIDPHLMTGLEMARRAGAAGLPENLSLMIDLLSDADQAESFRERFDKQRNEAKPVNFGLIYGMTVRSLHRKGRGEYNLDWNVQDAELGAEAFFDLYPELELWQAWTVLTPVHDGWVVSHRKGRTWQGIQNVQCRKDRIWKVTNLQGRAYFRNHWRQALNYQDQGTSAELLLSVMDTLPAEWRDVLLNQVHDELIFQVDPGCEVASVRQHMIEKANDVLGPYGIPGQVETTLAKTWS